MSYGELKIDTITFTAGGVDASVSVSGLVQNPTFTGNITTTGTISGDVIRGNTVSGATVTGDTGEFGNLTAVSGVFTTQVSGATVTGNVGLFGTITGGIHTLTSGVFASGTAANPSITFVDDLNTGIYSPGADQVAISTSGTGRLFVDGSGRVGIGNTTPGSYNAGGDDLVVGDNSGNRGITIAGGSTGESGLYFADGSTGGEQYAGLILYDHTTDSLRLWANANERARIDSSGRLGVGTTAMTAGLSVQTFGTQLAVNGNSYMFPSGRHYSHLGTVADGTHAYAGFDGGYGNTSGSCTFILQPGINNTTQEAGTYVAGELQGLASTALTFGHLTAASSVSGNATKTERMRIDSSGRVGIGTTSPGEELQIGSTTSASSTSPVTLSLGGQYTPQASISQSNLKLKVYDASTDAAGFTAGQDGLSYVGSKSGNHVWYRADASGTLFESFRSDSSGRLLVGTTSSVNTECLFQTAGDDSVRDWAIKYTGTSGGAETGIRWLDKNNAVNAQISNNLQDDGVGTAAAFLVFKTATGGTLTERMRILNTGLHRMLSSSGPTLEVRNTLSGSGDPLFQVAAGVTNMNTGGAVVMRVMGDGDVENATGVYTNPVSDERFKTDIVDVGSQWDDIKNVKLKKFRYKNNPDGELQLGIIAQELEPVCPNLIKRKIAGPEEVVASAGAVQEGEEYLSWKASLLPLKAVKALQEAMERIEVLEAKIAALEAQ